MNKDNSKFKSCGCFNWDIEAIAHALKIREKDVKEYFTDGRKISFLLERRLEYEILNGKRPESEGAGYDLIDAENGKWEVRCITRSGIYFCPSYMVGSGRHFEEQGFLDKLDEIKGYIVADVVAFPKIPYWTISKEQVKSWWNDGKLGSTTKISREKALKLINYIYPCS